MLHAHCEGAIERPPPCEMVQVASVFDLFCDLRLALSCSMARCSFQASCDAHHLILSFGVFHLSASQLIRSSRTDLIKDIIELIVRRSIVIRIVYLLNCSSDRLSCCLLLLSCLYSHCIQTLLGQHSSRFALLFSNFPPFFLRCSLQLHFHNMLLL